jgi:hypothetical protein
MTRKRSKRLDPAKCTAAIEAIQDILYLDSNDSGTFYNGSKEWSVEMLNTIADVLETAITRPPDATIECALCHLMVPEPSIHLDREQQQICDNCWDERLR